MTIDDRASSGVRRRALVRGAAWSVPAVLVATPAPAFALSCTQFYPGTFNWSTNFTKSSNNGGGGTMTFANGNTSTVTMSSTFTNYTPTNANYTVASAVGGTGKPGVTFYQTPNVSGTVVVIGLPPTKNTYFTNNRLNSQVITMTFGTAVYDLAFLLTDIDSASGDFIDAVEVTVTSPSGGTYVATTPTGSTVTTGTGASGSPFRQAGDNTGADNTTGTGGNKKLVFAGPVTTIQLRYWNAIGTTAVDQNQTPDQAIFLGEMTATLLNAGCA